MGFILFNLVFCLFLFGKVNENNELECMIILYEQEIVHVAKDMKVEFDSWERNKMTKKKAKEIRGTWNV